MNSSLSYRPSLLAALATLGLGSTALAQTPVTISNPGFETDVLADGNSVLTQSLSGWNGGYTSASDAPPYSLWVAFPGDSGASNPAPAGNYAGVVPQGANAGFTLTFPAFRQGIRQVLAETVQADASYGLSVKVGNPDVTNLGGAGPGYVINLVVNGTVVASTAGASPASGTFATATLNYVAPSTGNPLVGQPMEIRLLAADDGSTAARVDFDDVTLTRTLLNPLANAGGPYTVPVSGSLSLNGSASQPSGGQTLTLYEWDLDNNGSYDVTGATPAAISDVVLKTTYSMVYGSNTIKLRVTDNSSPTPKTAIGTATVTLAAPLGCQLGVLNLTANGGINPNTGIPWKVGDKYRIAFHTNGTTTTTSNDPEYYNDFVTTEAWTVPALRGAYWRAMITVNLDPTTTQALSPKREVKANTGTGDLTGGFAQGGAGEPVYVVNGTTCIARNNADIWNAWSNPFENSLGVPNTSGTGNNTTRFTGGFYSPYLNQNGAQTVNPNANHGKDVATGCNFDGTHVNALGNTIDAAKDINRGSSNANSTGRVWNRFTDTTATLRSLYVISVPLTVVNLAETVKPNLISFVDDRAGANLPLGTGPIVYTVTFSEAIDASTVTTADFENAGSATVTINSIRGTLNPAAFTVTVTPTTGGTVQLQTKVGTVIKDPVGNALDTTLALADDTSITVISDVTAPTLVSIADNVSGGPVLAFTGVTYTVTFDEAINASTVNIADFANGGSAPITINSVTPTGNPAVYTVSVTSTGAGTLTLGIVAGATITDLVGNSLVTTSVLPDDTTITVNPDPLPTLASIIDNQAGGPVYATQSFTYLVTFNQVINSSSVDVTDFENGGTPAITVNAVARTSNPSVFAVHVTPGGAGTITLRIKAGAVITNTNGTALNTTTAIADDTTITVNGGSGPARSTITVDGSAFASSTATSVSVTLNAGSSDKLVVIVTGENGNPGDLTGNSNAVTYDGVPLTKVIDRNPIGGTPYDQTFNDIWYLDNPATSTGSIVASVNSRGSVTAFALSGTALGVGQTAISPQASKSVVLSTSFANSIVIASHGMGGDGNSANVTAVDAVLPLVERTATAQTSGSPSPWDGHVTASALIPLAGTASYAFTGGNLVGSHTIAAEFLAAEVVVGTPYGNWAGGPFAGTLTNPSANVDFDNGGLATGIEWVVGGDPTNGSDDAGLAPTLDNTTDPQFFIFTYRRSQAANADANTTIVAEYGSTLGGWTPATAGPDIIITPTIGIAPGIDSVQVKIRRSLAVGGKLFAHLKVMIAP